LLRFLSPRRRGPARWPARRVVSSRDRIRPAGLEPRGPRTSRLAARGDRAGHGAGAQAGDVAERSSSARFGVKDSSTLIPGTAACWTVWIRCTSPCPSRRGCSGSSASHDRRVAILGSTGSIGCSTLQVLARQRERFRVAALTAHSNADLLRRQAAEWKPAYVGWSTVGAGSGSGERTSCLVEAATRPDVDIVVNGTWARGLEPRLRRSLPEAGGARQQGDARDGGRARHADRARGRGEIVRSTRSTAPCCNAHRAAQRELARLISRRRAARSAPDPKRVAGATVDEALRHPTGKLGKKITVDSASLVNKALR